MFIYTIRVPNSLDPDGFCRASSGSKLFVKIISRRQKMPLNGESKTIAQIKQGQSVVFISLSTLCVRDNFHVFLLFLKGTFPKKIFQEHYQTVKRLDPDEVFVVVYLLFFFKKKIFQEHYQSVKRFGSRCVPTFCQASSGSKLFSEV